MQVTKAEFYSVLFILWMYLMLTMFRALRGERWTDVVLIIAATGMMLWCGVASVRAQRR